MDLVFSDLAKKELENLPQELKLLFLNRLEKMMVVPPRKRMKHGILCHVVKVTKQARIVCEIRGEKIFAVPSIVLSMSRKRDEMIAVSENIFISLAITIDGG